MRSNGSMTVTVDQFHTLSDILSAILPISKTNYEKGGLINSNGNKSLCCVCEGRGQNKEPGMCVNDAGWVLAIQEPNKCFSVLQKLGVLSIRVYVVYVLLQRTNGYQQGHLMYVCDKLFRCLEEEL